MRLAGHYYKLSSGKREPSRTADGKLNRCSHDENSVEMTQKLRSLTVI